MIVSDTLYNVYKSRAVYAVKLRENHVLPPQ